MRWIGQIMGRKANARQVSLLLMGAMVVLAAGCGRRQPTVATQPPEPPKPVEVAKVEPPPPPPPKPSAPVIDSFTADPTRMERGQSATLRWAVRGATEVTVDQGLGAVQPSGSRQVFPSSTLTYTLTARSNVGEVSRSVTVEVVSAPPPPAPVKDNGGTISQRMSQLQDVHFDFDMSEITPDNQAILRQDAQLLRQIFTDFPTLTLVVEGHCDERGSSEYNLALGDRRAITVRQALASLGIPEDRMRTLSYGEERPVCSEAAESCYSLNRRAHFAPGQ